MDISRFQNYLLNSGSSELTVKNYTSDIRRFIRFFETKYSLGFQPERVTWKMLKDYRALLASEIGLRSVERHMSSLRKFFQFLEMQGQIKETPFSLSNEPTEESLDSAAGFRQFKDYLYSAKSSDLTIKNYIIDVRQFLFWLSLTEDQSAERELTPKEVISRVSPDALASYKQRLIHQSDLSVSSINRKLSSLRTYMRWACRNGIVDASNLSNSMEIDQMHLTTNVKETDPLGELYGLSEIQEEAEILTPYAYSSFPPLRLMQKTSFGLTMLADILLVVPLANIIAGCQHLLWRANGAELFNPRPGLSGFQTVTPDSISQIKNIEKIYYPKKPLSPMQMALHRKLAYYTLHVRPLWYRKYKSYTVVRGMHSILTTACIALAVMLIYNNLMTERDQRVLGQSIAASGRTLSFKGALTDKKGAPITKDSSLHFSIYANPTGQEEKLWEETRQIKPDARGGFIVALGEGKEIPASIFTGGEKLYIGVSVDNEAELTPRQQIPNVALAEDSQTLQGLLPLTHPKAGSENVILALDSSGNLTLGGEKAHTFQSGGSFQIKGQNIILAALPGSGGSIVLKPEGQGIIDLQKGIQNTSEDIIGIAPAGAVVIKDLLAVDASSSTSAALSINQNGFGPLISASASGITRFSVDNIGSTTIGHNLTVGGTDIASTRSVFNLLNRNVTIVNFAGESEAVTIGSASGTTTIRNAKTTISGDLTVMGNTGITLSGNNAGLSFSGGGNHTIGATAGNLRLGTTLNIGENVNIIPETKSGTNSIGSSANPFDNIYAENFVIPGKSALTASGLGLGTVTPSYQLHVTSPNSNSAIVMIENSDLGADADVLNLKIGTLSPSTSNKFINFLDGANNSLGSIQASGSGGVTYLTSGSDFAEYFRKENREETMIAGDLVCLGPNGGVTKCNTQINQIVGVITDRAGFVGASDKAKDPNYVLVGLNGQVHIRVKSADRILPGDTLGVSGLSGIAQKSNSSGQIIGRALSSSNGSTSVLAYILPSWHDPNTLMDGTGNLTLVPTEATDTNTKSYFVIDKKTNEILGSVGVFSEAVIGSLRAGFLEASDIVVKNSLNVGGTLFASAVKAKEVSAETLSASEGLFAKAVKAESINADKIVAPIVEAEKIKVSILSPVSDDALTVHLNNRRVDFVAADKPEPVASIDDEGNASFAGSLKTTDAKVEGELEADTINSNRLTVADATVSGTLQVREVIADKLSLSDAAVESLMERLSMEMAGSLAALLEAGANRDEVAAIVEPLLEEVSENQEEIATPSATSLAFSEVNTQASPSSSLPTLPLLSQNVDLERVSINQALMVFGVTSLAQAAVSDLLSIGTSLTIQGNAINTLGETLEIQPLAQGEISFMAGKIRIDKDGNAVFNENLSINKTLFARDIRPLGKNLDINLKEDQKISVKGASEAALTINSLGDLVSSGSGSFFELIGGNFKVVRGAQADTSDTETIASGSAGVATILPGELERTIVSPFVNEESLIYLTPASQTFGTTPFIARQTPEKIPQSKGSFTIRIQEEIDSEIKVNWWVIN